ncbi:MAG TPA: DEAD/DEAH box helicase [Kiritimatiellia bacterium]|nr:DEAD/DEAH box helicase [Kiritimatiellia bacterium]
MTQPADGFNNLGISSELLKALERLSFHTPTPIQLKAIPIANEGSDIIGIAQTGTGKTMAFGIPMIQRLAKNQKKGLVLVPTRELAVQVNESLAKLTSIYQMKTLVLIGGESMRPQLQKLRERPRVIIATPGRMNDHLKQKSLQLNDVDVLVLDEADRMLDMGFLSQIEDVLRRLPRERQNMLFSATMPASIVKIAQKYMHLPVRVEIAPEGTATELVSQELFVVTRENKGALLGQLLRQYEGSVLLFVRTRRSAGKVAKIVRNHGHSVAEIHADRSLAQRKEALRSFKAGQSRVLVATDIAARGIDVKGIQLVINYDLPDDPENYVHRIGRTGRAGREGHAVSLATPDQAYEVRRIEKMMRIAIPIARHPEIPVEQFEAHATSSPAKPAGRRRSFGGHQRMSRKKNG